MTSSARLDSTRTNLLLARLSVAERERLAPFLQRRLLAGGESLCEPGKPPSAAYFPIDCVLSLLCRTKPGASLLVGLIGQEGFLGYSLLTGLPETPQAATVLQTGYCYELAAAALGRDFEAGSSLRRLILRYTQSLVTQLAQAAVCNRYHTVEQQLCRLLLSIVDRPSRSRIDLTHESIAHLLGVRREGVTEAAHLLMDKGAIEYRRGHITVLQRSLLESRACECYELVRSELRRCASTSSPNRYMAES